MSKKIRIRVMSTGREESSPLDANTKKLIDEFRMIPVPPHAPLLRFFGPDYDGERQRYRIVWTMMETYRIHDDMVRKANDYNEAWFPTEWNRQIFVESGLRIPSYVMRLGVDPDIFRHVSDAKLPECVLVTTDSAGKKGVPEGFKFLTVGLPSFRKGFDVLTEAFEKAFGERDDVHLILGLTHSLRDWILDVQKMFRGLKARVWILSGKFQEEEMAWIYSACNAYVSASRGEGWNLPACEAAACGLPVIVPNNTCHQEVFGDGGFLFSCEGVREYKEAESVSPWYVGMPFANFGPRSVDDLVDRLREVERGGLRVREQASKLTSKVRSEYTWDKAAQAATQRVLELCGMVEDTDQSRTSLHGASASPKTKISTEGRFWFCEDCGTVGVIQVPENDPVEAGIRLIAVHSGTSPRCSGYGVKSFSRSDLASERILGRMRRRKRPLIVSFYTNDTYEGYAFHLEDSIRCLRLDYEIEKISGIYTWRDAVLSKPSFIKKMLLAHPDQDIVWIDADAKILSYPDLLMKESPEFDIAYYCPGDRPSDPFGGTVFYRNSTTVHRLVDDWIDECRQNPDLLDERSLHKLVTSRSDVVFKTLPPTYCWVERWMRKKYPFEVPVIEQYAASRPDSPSERINSFIDAKAK
jgi:hypothetical protein